LSRNFGYLCRLALRTGHQRQVAGVRSRQKAPDISGALFRGTTFVLAGAS